MAEEWKRSYISSILPRGLSQIPTDSHSLRAGQNWYSILFAQHYKTVNIHRLVCLIGNLKVTWLIRQGLFRVPSSPDLTADSYQTGRWCDCIETETKYAATVFLPPQLLFFFFFSLFVLMQLLFKGGVYFVGKPADSNDGCSKYMRAIQLGPDRRW